MHSYFQWVERLKKSLENTLPGADAQSKMAPRAFGKSLRNFKPSETAKHSAVLIPVVNLGSTANILFTVRSGKLKSHSGQISFPGGKPENGESLQLTALRETWEETGIGNDFVNIIGSLSKLYVPPSNTIIHPYIGFIEKLPELKPNPDEVEEIFFVTLETFLTGEVLKTFQQKIAGYEAEVPFWDVHKRVKLWGATAMILSELVTLIKIK